MKPEKVAVTWFEIQMAAAVGLFRRTLAKQKGREDKMHKPSHDWYIELEGAISELVVAKYLGRYWDGSIDTFKRPDIAPDIQVRYSKRPFLVIRPGDSEKERFVLVNGEDQLYLIQGWVYGFEAKRREEWKKAPNGGAPAWFVPVRELHDPALMRRKLQAGPGERTNEGV